jgi:glycosyltransferase involved in cell wall biosynthesis
MRGFLCDLPVITINYGGPRDFLDENNSYLVDIDELEISENFTDVYYWDQYQFPKLGENFTDNFADALRDFVNNYKMQQNKNIHLQKFIINNLQGDVVGAWAKRELDNVYKTGVAQ